VKIRSPSPSIAEAGHDGSMMSSWVTSFDSQEAVMNRLEIGWAVRSPLPPWLGERFWARGLMGVKTNMGLLIR